MTRRSRTSLSLAAIYLALAASAGSARAVDEIQVYNAEIAKVGQWTMQMHLNYAINGRKEADFPGGLVPHHALNGTPEWAYGVTDWWEIGFYAPYAVSKDGQFLSNGIKLRQLFVTPNADQREFFYGVNFEFSYTTPLFSESRFESEIRPIIGFRRDNYEFIVNPIVDIGFGTHGETEFAPAVRFARNFSDNLSLGVEYYSALGPFRSFLPVNEQQHNVFAVADFKIGRFDINAGIGYGLTGGSDRLLAKLIVGTELTEGRPAKALQMKK